MTPPQPEDRAEAREIYFHEDDHAKDRTDWFFIGHAILIEAFFATGATPWAGTLVAIVAFASAVFWLLVGCRQLDNLLVLRDLYQNHSELYRGVQEKRLALDKRGWRKWGRASRFFLVWLPGLFTLFWSVALVCSVACGWPHPGH